MNGWRIAGDPKIDLSKIAGCESAAAVGCWQLFSSSGVSKCGTCCEFRSQVFFAKIATDSVCTIAARLKMIPQIASTLDIIRCV